MKSWSDLYADPAFSPPRYPEPVVVRWWGRVLAEGLAGAPVSALDLGCGAMRHLKMMAVESSHREIPAVISGCDGAITFNRLYAPASQKDGTWREVDLKTCEADDLPYPDASFDAVLCWGVLYYLPVDRYKAALREIHRVLRPGGKALVMVKHADDMRNLGHVPPAEQGMPLTFCDIDDLRTMCAAAGFGEVVLNTAIQGIDGNEWLEIDIHAYLTK